MTTPERSNGAADENDGTGSFLPDAIWVPDDALKALVTEKEIHPDEDDEAVARRIMRENVGAVTMGIIHTALYGANERVRLDAQKYVVERVLGKVGDDAYGGESSPIDTFINDVVEYVAEQKS